MVAFITVSGEYLKPSRIVPNTWTISCWLLVLHDCRQVDKKNGKQFTVASSEGNGPGQVIYITIIWLVAPLNNW